MVSEWERDKSTGRRGRQEDGGGKRQWTMHWQTAEDKEGMGMIFVARVALHCISWFMDGWIDWMIH